MAADEWVSQIATGDREAFRIVYEKYGKTVYQRALNKTGSKEQAQTVLKNVFRTLLRQLQDSNSDPLLFLLEGLTDLETGGANGQGAADGQAAPTPTAAPTTTAPITAAATAAAPIAAAPTVSVPVVTTPIAATPTAVAPMATAPIAAEQAPNAPSSLFDRAETEYGGEYAHAAISPENLRTLADAPAQAEADLSDGAFPMDAAEDDPPKTHRGAVIFLTVLLTVLVLVTLWFGAGVLMMYSVLPKLDLGYSWFNENLFNLFRF